MSTPIMKKQPTKQFNNTITFIPKSSLDTSTASAANINRQKKFKGRGRTSKKLFVDFEKRKEITYKI